MYPLWLIHVLFASGNIIATNSETVWDRYIITLKPETNADQHMDSVQKLHSRELQGRRALHMEEYHIDMTLAVSKDMPVIFTVLSWINYETATRWRELKTIIFGALSSRPVMHADGCWDPDILRQKDADYGLSQISHKNIPTKNEYIYHKSAGTRTFGYVVDTGIYAGHGEFAKLGYKGRVKMGYNAVRNGTFQDLNGHGTHVAALIGGKNFGVAKRCNLISVKVIDDSTGHISDILDGFMWAVRDIVNKKRQAESVINVSLHGEFSYAFDSALQSAFHNDVSTVACAGNDQDARKSSPGASEHAITAGAADKTRQRAAFSNYGPQVNIFAPGVDIVSAGIGGRWKSQIIDGTSQASAYVAGLVLYFKSLTNLESAGATRDYLLSVALTGVVNEPKSPNKFAYNGVGE